MNKLISSKRAQILRCLCERNSMRATARLVDCSFKYRFKIAYRSRESMHEISRQGTAKSTLQALANRRSLGFRRGERPQLFDREESARVGFGMGLDCALCGLK